MRPDRERVETEDTQAPLWAQEGVQAAGFREGLRGVEPGPGHERPAGAGGPRAQGREWAQPRSLELGSWPWREGCWEMRLSFHSGGHQHHLHGSHR